MRVRRVAVLAWCGLFVAAAAAQDADNCRLKYYAQKDPACLDAIVAANAASSRGETDTDTSGQQSLVGFFAALFATDAGQRERIVALDATDHLRAVLTEALIRAGFPEDAKRYASRSALGSLFDMTMARSLVPLNDLVANEIAGDVDLLIGAYMESGDPRYVQKVLLNFSRVDEGLARDALRVGYVMSRFGPTAAIPGRSASLPVAVCDKYRCKVDAQKTQQVMTLATAFWATRSLSQTDEGVGLAVGAFLVTNPRLKEIVASEAEAFAKYRAAYAAFAAGQREPAIEAVLTRYESLGAMPPVDIAR